jgi:Fic family protein
MSVPPRAITYYTQPRQFEPLMPSTGIEDLVGRSIEVLDRSQRLAGAVHPATRLELRELLRAMNSYYSNRIEGQGTHPRNIERALRADFSSKPDVARLQRIALAHIEAERSLGELLERKNLDSAEVLASSFLQEAHRDFYVRLSADDRRSPDGVVVEPGRLRTQDVDVGLHLPPTHGSIGAFLARMDEVYPVVRGRDRLLAAIAAQHHRAAWVHPFVDGNGRACRLQTHCALLPFTAGLWSVSRGFARDRERYYERLADADGSRRGDLDGRGNLSESGLLAWCQYFVEVCEDQVNFMSRMLNLDGLRQRIAALVAARDQMNHDGYYRQEAALPLHHVLVAGPVERGEFCRLTGLPERTARRALRQLLDDGLLASNTPKGPVRFAFSLDSLPILLPNLYPEAASNLDD